MADEREQGASAPEDFVEARETITLPVKQGGKELRITIRALEPAVVLKQFESIPQLLSGDTSEQAQRSVAESIAGIAKESDTWEQIAGLGIVEPRVCFNGTPEAGTVAWGRFHWENRMFAVVSIIHLSGLFKEAMATFLTFRALVGKGAGAGGEALADGGSGTAAGLVAALDGAAKPAGGADV